MRNPSTLGARVRPRLFIGLCTALAVCATIVLSAAFSGHVYTSLGGGTSSSQTSTVQGSGVPQRRATE